MFKRLKMRLMNWAAKKQMEVIMQLAKENREMRAKILERDGEIRLTEEQKKRLAEKRKGIDPDILKALDAFELEDDK